MNGGASPIRVTVPASSANLGPGFDVLGMALDLHATAGVGGDPVDGARFVDEHHPASVAFAAAGGHGRLWVHAPIPMGRGLGFSGAVRVAGAVAARAQADDHVAGRFVDAVSVEAVTAVLDIVAELEGHADNAAASLFGGVIVVGSDGEGEGRVVTVPVALRPAIVVWIPDGTTTSTDRSRTSLPATVPFADAVFNVGRAAMLVAAVAGGDVDALAMATADRLHQDTRLERVPDSAAALEAGLALGAWCGWLSGSGPTVALMCDPDDATRIAAGLTADGHTRSGHTKVLAIDAVGATVARG